MKLPLFRRSCITFKLNKLTAMIPGATMRCFLAHFLGVNTGKRKKKKMVKDSKNRTF